MVVGWLKHQEGFINHHSVVLARDHKNKAVQLTDIRQEFVPAATGLASQLKGLFRPQTPCLVKGLIPYSEVSSACGAI